MRCRLFFFYGTLIQEYDNATTRAVRSLLSPLGRATAPGIVLAVRDPQGWYPVLRTGCGTVQGWLYATRPGFSAGALRLLDAYEQADRRAGRREYRRRAIWVRQGQRVVRAEAYVHDRPAHCGMPRVATGDFARFLLQRRRKAFGCSNVP